MPEVAIQGWKGIARIFNKSVVTMMKRRDEMLEAGVIFYMHAGRPPRRMVHAFPSNLIRYTVIKASKGELV